MTKQYQVGVTDVAPSIGSDTLTATFLKKCKINFIFVNDQILLRIGDAPGWTHDIYEGILYVKNTDGTPYSFKENDTLLVNSKSFKCKKCC